jgi:hypothetical protein
MGMAGYAALTLPAGCRPCALSDRLLTLPDGPGRFWPCVSRFSVKSPALKLSPPGPVFAKSRDCDESMDAGRWRKRKGIARVRLSDGSIHVAEVHWYEAAGIGRKEFKIKHLL